MFNADFYPTPQHVSDIMLSHVDVKNKTVLEPSAGKGDLIDALKTAGAKKILICENDPQLKKLLTDKGDFLKYDFLDVKAEEISHIDAIVMNPPFSQADKHILHAFNIAPEGCEIIALCNWQTIKNAYTKTREELKNIIDSSGYTQNLGDCFTTAERKTDIDVGMVYIKKPGATAESDYFNGFFMDEDPEEQQGNGLIQYNVVRDLVQRYVNACKIFKRQVESANELSKAIDSFYKSNIAFIVRDGDKERTENEFKIDLQKNAWKFIFDKLDMQKNNTQKLRADLNKFIEQQQQIPFTMRNIYRMLEIIQGTHSQRMDAAVIDVYEKLTKHTHENRFAVEGWKTNDNYLLNRKFICPYMCPVDKWHTGSTIALNYGGYFDHMEDLVKALCYITGQKWEQYGELKAHIRNKWKVHHSNKIDYFNTDVNYGGYLQKTQELEKSGIPYKVEISMPEYGKEFEWAFFKVKAYKKGTMHFEFKDENVWALFNQRIAKLKGFGLPEKIRKNKNKPKHESKVLFEI